MVRTQIQLTESQAERLKRLAAEEGVSMAALIRDGVERLLASRGPVDRKARIQRALAAAGRFRSGEPGLAREHDEAFVEAVGE